MGPGPWRSGGLVQPRDRNISVRSVLLNTIAFLYIQMPRLLHHCDAMFLEATVLQTHQSSVDIEHWSDIDAFTIADYYRNEVSLRIKE